MGGVAGIVEEGPLFAGAACTLEFLRLHRGASSG